MTSPNQTQLFQLDSTAVENFREYLRIPSVHPNINYDECVAFVERQAKSLDLPVRKYEVFPKNPILVLTWEGTEPEKPSILLNGHMDVVPVFPELWTYPPFSAHVDEKGNIYARGSQDMKCINIQYLEAIRRLKLNGIRLKRTVHISFVPDEERGGRLGMKDFIKTQDFKNLNVGFALDEGMASPNDNFLIFYGERSIWHVWIECTGKPGHGSLMPDNTVGEKFMKVIDKFMEFRASEKAKLRDSKLKIGDVTSINLTQVQGGVQMNVIPSELRVGFDIRIATDVNHEEFEKMIQNWIHEAGEGISYSFEERNPFVENTKLDETNPFWLAFKNVCDTNKLTLESGIFTGGTDSRYIRSCGVPAIGFSPINNTPVLLHDNNEFLNKDVFLRGIQIYEKLIPAIANV
ncbi:aminoacylase-1-like [Leptopilina heterotoma]|uniref:aminoacylase-1-like n=1 Tax=Leptopilina heterotoma TaxID=63436 RepID=UPI001CA99D5C|nr:aminoacylase-1-like [Leptopilina heterotoma]